jgi:tetratricopeptide (TPR) repeat protein
MTPREQQSRIKSIFADASELPDLERGEFISQVCGDDSALRAEVERLLRFHDATLDTALSAPTPLSERPGEFIGRYKLIQLIGEGGFGSVYLAEQLQPVQRQVALKIIKLGMDTRQVIARFEVERQALAMMDHLNIARVIDAGATDTGRPYFVMDLVRGEPLTEYCERNKVGLRDRLKLFMDICAAVQHAHQKGIIHRDIKPSNILVSSHERSPIVKVIDFGIAKATHQRLTEKTLFTEARQLVGTPVYMSPEQAEMSGLDVDTRTDIYSLGVLLYELLTGMTPFEPTRLRSAGYGEMARIIREEEPPRPSTRVSAAGESSGGQTRLRRDLEGELDWIVMKAMEKDRTRRYQTAAALAGDIERYLTDRPVEAGPPSTTYRVGKFMKRNRAAVVMAGIVVTSLILGLALALVGIVHARRQRDAALTAQAAEEKARRAAEQAQQRALQSHRDSMAVLTFFTDTLSRGDPSVSGRERTVRQALDAAAETIEQKFRDRPYIEGQVRAQLGFTYYGLGLYDKALEQLPRALEIYRQVTGPQSDSTHSVTLKLVDVYIDSGRHELATPLIEQVRAAVERRDDWRTAGTLQTLSMLSDHYRKLGRHSEAEALARRGYDARREALGEDDPSTQTSLWQLAVALDVQDRTADAEPLFRRLFDTQQRLYGFDNWTTLGTANSLALVVSRLDRFEEARELHERVVEARKRMGQADHPDSLVSMSNLAAVLGKLKRYDQAAALYEHVLPAKQRTMGPSSPSTIRTLADMAIMEYDRADFAASAQLWAQVKQLAPRAFPDRHPILASFYANSGVVLLKLEQYEQAESDLLEAHRRHSLLLGEQSTEARRVATQLVNLYQAWEKPQESEPWRGKAGATTATAPTDD